MAGERPTENGGQLGTTAMSRRLFTRPLGEVAAEVGGPLSPGSVQQFQEDRFPRFEVLEDRGLGEVAAAAEVVEGDVADRHPVEHLCRGVQDRLAADLPGAFTAGTLERHPFILRYRQSIDTGPTVP